MEHFLRQRFFFLQIFQPLKPICNSLKSDLTYSLGPGPVPFAVYSFRSNMLPALVLITLYSVRRIYSLYGFDVSLKL